MSPWGRVRPLALCHPSGLPGGANGEEGEHQGENTMGILSLGRVSLSGSKREAAFGSWIYTDLQPATPSSRHFTHATHCECEYQHSAEKAHSTVEKSTVNSGENQSMYTLEKKHSSGEKQSKQWRRAECTVERNPPSHSLSVSGSSSTGFTCDILLSPEFL